MSERALDAMRELLACIEEHERNAYLLPRVVVDEIMACARKEMNIIQANEIFERVERVRIW
jgi:hypothetical protein